MVSISLTDFVDIACKTGTPKATKVAQVKRRPDYEPQFDYYKGIRERIGEMHKKSCDVAFLRSYLSSVHSSKRDNYSEIVEGYVNWLGRKATVWHIPPKKSYQSAGVKVIVNPEIGLTFGGQSHLVKLYFKDEKLSRFPIDVILSLMECTLRPHAPGGETMSVLDVRNSKLFSWRKSSKSLMHLVDAELAYIGSIWPRV